MFMFKWIPAALAALSLYVAAPTKAAEVTAGQALLIDTLTNANVDLIVDECPTEEFYGLYSAKHNTIIICTNVATDADQRWETLRHEAIHAAQACVDPSMDTTAQPLMYVYDSLSKRDFRAVRGHYSEEDWQIEYEAFTFMRYSNTYVADVVAKACL